MARRTAPTQQQLLELVPHIHYDLTQLVEVGMLCPWGRSAETVEENVFIDGALVYARKLLAFLDAPEDQREWREGDVFARDYNDEWRIPPSWWTNANREVMKAISTRAAHICVARIDKYAWNIPAVAGSITEAMLAFIRSLDDRYEAAFLALPIPVARPPAQP